MSSVRALERPANLQKPPEICQEIGTFRHDGLSLERVARHDHSARSALCFFLQCEASERSERAAVGLPHRFRAKYMMLPHPIIITGNCQGNLDENTRTKMRGLTILKNCIPPHFLASDQNAAKFKKKLHGGPLIFHWDSWTKCRHPNKISDARTANSELRTSS